jgi:hypothetical protein
MRVRSAWTEAERETLREVYPRDGAKAAADALGRTLGSIFRVAQRLGLNRRRWRAEGGVEC